MSCTPHLSLEPGKVRWAENVLASEKSAPSKLPWMDVLLIPHPSSCIPFLMKSACSVDTPCCFSPRGTHVINIHVNCQFSSFFFSLGIKEQYVIIAGYLGGNMILAWRAGWIGWCQLRKYGDSRTTYLSVDSWINWRSADRMFLWITFINPHSWHG